MRICDGGFLRPDDLLRKTQELVELGVLGFGGGAFADFQDDVSIGAQCVILPGITIRAGAMVGAGSVVTSDIPSGVTVAGNPAEIIEDERES